MSKEFHDKIKELVIEAIKERIRDLITEEDVKIITEKLKGDFNTDVKDTAVCRWGAEPHRWVHEEIRNALIEKAEEIKLKAIKEYSEEAISDEFIKELVKSRINDVFYGEIVKEEEENNEDA